VFCYKTYKGLIIDSQFFITATMNCLENLKTDADSVERFLLSKEEVTLDDLKYLIACLFSKFVKEVNLSKDQSLYHEFIKLFSFSNAVMNVITTDMAGKMLNYVRRMQKEKDDYYSQRGWLGKSKTFDDALIYDKPRVVKYFVRSFIDANSYTLKKAVEYTLAKPFVKFSFEEFTEYSDQDIAEEEDSDEDDEDYEPKEESDEDEDEDDEHHQEQESEDEDENMRG